MSNTKFKTLSLTFDTVPLYCKGSSSLLQIGTLPACGTLCQLCDILFDLPSNGATLLQKGDDDLLQALRFTAREMW